MGHALRVLAVVLVLASSLVGLAPRADAETNRPPVVAGIRAELLDPFTFYDAAATDPEGDALTYTWKIEGNEAGCNNFSATGGTDAFWSHDSAGCTHNGQPHVGTITATVTDGLHPACVVRYTGGSAAGTGPAPVGEGCGVAEPTTTTTTTSSSTTTSSTSSSTTSTTIPRATVNPAPPPTDSFGAPPASTQPTLFPTTTSTLAPKFTVKATWTGDGAIASPQQLFCSQLLRMCEGLLPAGTAVVLKATPGTGSRLTSWGGDCGGPEATCSLTMDRRHDVTALFETGPVQITVEETIGVLDEPTPLLGPAPLVVTVDETIGVLDDPAPVLGPAPVLVLVDETIGVLDEPTPVLGPAPLAVVVEETIGVLDYPVPLLGPEPLFLSVEEAVVVADDPAVIPPVVIASQPTLIRRT